jgi:putative acyl-CoA dehydrogenase
MAMTEKQGGSDVRANTTIARPLNGGGPAAEYEITGHKWFCSAPMCDAFLVLAQADGGLSCFLLPASRLTASETPSTSSGSRTSSATASNASSEV